MTALKVGDEVITRHGKKTTIVVIDERFFLNRGGRECGYRDADGYWWQAAELTPATAEASS